MRVEKERAEPSMINEPMRTGTSNKRYSKDLVTDPCSDFALETTPFSRWDLSIFSHFYKNARSQIQVPNAQDDLFWISEWGWLCIAFAEWCANVNLNVRGGPSTLTLSTRAVESAKIKEFELKKDDLSQWSEFVVNACLYLARKLYSEKRN